jgi:predicted TIM-barrel fold metal-dependent hydrolase
LLILLLIINCDEKYETEFDESGEIANVAEPYKDLLVIDIHNHDASGYSYQIGIDFWNNYSIDRIVLFGDISEPSAKETDEIAFEVYKHNKERFYPFIAGINIHDESCLDYIRERFDAGVFGIGEVVAASTYSPLTSNLPWKGQHPLDGFFPEIYELCAEYNKPILLHIDPPSGVPVEKLIEAAGLYPQTKFIFAHANAYNTPQNIENVIKDHNNIYIDFFAGFTAYNSDSSWDLDDYSDLILAYPDRFMVSSDGGYGIGYDNAYTAIYELFDLIGDESIVKKLAHENFLKLISK